MYPAREMSIQYPSVQDDMFNTDRQHFGCKNDASSLPPEAGVPNNKKVWFPGHTVVERNVENIQQMANAFKFASIDSCEAISIVLEFSIKWRNSFRQGRYTKDVFFLLITQIST